MKLAFLFLLVFNAFIAVNDHPQKIIGVWQSTDEDSLDEFHFMKNDSFKLSFYEEDTLILKGEYKLKEDCVYLKISEELGYLKHTVLKLNDSIFSLKYKNHVVNYSRKL